MHDLDFASVDPHFHHWDPLTTPRVVSPFARVLNRCPQVYEKVASVVMPQLATFLAARRSCTHTSRVSTQRTLKA